MLLTFLTSSAHQQSTLINDLALILAVAALTTLLFRWLKQPLVLGYILAGILVGPQTHLFPSVTDTASIQVWAEIGVIFLLFSLGLEFSFKKLLHVGGTVFINAFIEIAINVFVGYGVGRLLGWTNMDSIFLGGMLAASSTTIILRAFEELRVKAKSFANIVFGVLIVEDIVVILILVILPTIAISKQFEGKEMIFTMLKLSFFLVIWFLAGIYIVPTFLKRARKMMDNETLLIFSIGMCLLMVILATQAGFSAALGAFIMGSIFAETTSAEKIEHILISVKNLFGAIFFVSIGMMIDLNSIWVYKIPILILSIVVIVSKFGSVTLGAIISGQSLKQSVQVGMSMGQIGEFAFIIATLGITLKVTSDFLFPIAVAVSAITTFTTPYMIKSSDKVYDLIEKILPNKIVNRIDKYASNTQKIKSTNEWQAVIKDYISLIVINGLVIIALMLIGILFVFPATHKILDNYSLANIINLLILGLVTSPFFWALTIKRPKSLAYKELWVNRNYKGPLYVTELIRLVAGFILVIFILDNTLPGGIGLVIAAAVIIVSVILFRTRLQKFYSRIEKRFLFNLHEREYSQKSAYNFSDPNSHLTPWDAHLAEFEVKQLSPFIGKKLQDLQWREKYGINVALIERGDKIIYPAGRDNMLFPGDRIKIIGTDEQLNLFRPIIDETEIVSTFDDDVDDIVLKEFSVDEINKLQGKTIRNSGLREDMKGIVVGIERKGERILNPHSDFEFEWDDTVWIVGDRKLLKALEKKK